MTIYFSLIFCLIPNIFALNNTTNISVLRRKRNVQCNSLLEESKKGDFDLCFYWIALDFSDELHYGIGATDEFVHFAQICKKLKNVSTMQSIAYTQQKFPNLTVGSKKIFYFVDVLIFCSKNDWIITRDETNALNIITSSFYHQLLAKYRHDLVAKKKPKNVNNISKKCSEKGFPGESCIAIITGKSGVIPFFDVGLLRMSHLPQFEIPIKDKNYFPKQEYESYPIDYLALGNKRFCKLPDREYTGKNIFTKEYQDRILNASKCVVLATPNFYHQLCCCDENLQHCNSLENAIMIDPGKPIFLVKDKLDEPDKLKAYELDENSIRQKYQKKLNESLKIESKIICAIGTLKTNVILKENRSLNEAFPLNVYSCQSIYRYKKQTDKQYQMSIEMNAAFGCTLARQTVNGFHYCQMRNLICPMQKSFVEKEELIIECCCKGYHLCNHDMYSHNAFTSLPIFMENPLCGNFGQLSSFRFTFLSVQKLYCAVHYDFVLGKVVNLLMNVNMDLTREEDYSAYEQLGCKFIEAKIRVHIAVRCTDNIYQREDTLMGRLIYMCTCPGKASSVRMNETACDTLLEKKIAQKAKIDAQKSKLPSCYYIDLITETINSAPTGISKFLLNNITKSSTETFWCYDQLEIEKIDDKLVSHWISDEVKLHSTISDICVKISTEDGEYTCTTFEYRVICCCKNYGNIPCNKNKTIESIFMRELVPTDLEWRKNEEAFRQAQYFCIKPDRNLAQCKSPMGCYQIRYSISNDPRIEDANDLPAGCISDIDQELLENYPYLTLCSIYLANGFAKKCFYTGRRDTVLDIPLIVCCCNTNPFNDCPSHAHVENLGYAYKGIKDDEVLQPI